MKHRRLRLLGAFAAVLAIAGACTTGGSAPPASTTPSTATSAAPSSEPSAASGGLARVEERGLYPAFFGEDPFAYIDQPNGNYTGLDAEVVKACATKIGLDPATQIFPVQVQWDALIPGLISKRYDLIAAGMSSAPKRLEVAIATQPLYQAGSRAMVPAGNPDNIHSWNDVKDKGLEFGYVTGGLEADFGESIGVKSRGYDTLDAMARDVKAGRLKVIITAENTLARYIQTTGEPFELADPWDYQGQVFTPTIYFNKDDTDLRDAFNDCVTELKNDGTLTTLMEQFTFDPKNMLPVGPGLP